MEIEKQLEVFIIKIACLGKKHIKYDEPLIGSGILDSLGFFMLLAFIEKTFDVFIDMNKTDIDKVNSINALTRLIAGTVKQR